MQPDHVGAVRDFYASAARGEFARAVLDPEIVWIEFDVPDLWFGGAHHGPDAVWTEVIEPAFKQIDDFRVQCEQLIDAGDHVIVAGRFTGRAKATGILLDAPFAHLWTFGGDKAVRFQGYTDTANWLYALCRIQVEHPVGV